MVQPLAPIHLGKTRISFLSKNGNRKSTKHYHTLSQGHPSFLGTFFWDKSISSQGHPPVIKPGLLENPIKSLFRSMSFSFKPPVIGVLLASHVWLPKGNNKQNTHIFPLRANVIWLAALAHLRYTIGMIIPLEWHHNPVLGMEKNLWHMFKPPVRGIPTRWVKHGNMARLAAGNIWNHQPPLMFIIILHIYICDIIFHCTILYKILL